MLRDAVIDALRPFPFRGKLRLLGSVAPKHGERSAQVFGYTMRLDLGEAIQRWIYLGTFEPEETAHIKRWLKPGMTFLDVGANVGYYTLLAAARVGRAGRVFAVEPSPYAFGRLEETVRANRLEQVRTVQAGLSSEEGELTLYVPPLSSGFHSPTMSAGAEGDAVTVPVRRLDRCLEEWSVERIDLMKLDVEGHEPFVLRGGAEPLRAGKVRAVLCELNDYWLREQGSSPRELYDMLTELGFVDQDGPAELAAGCIETRFFVHSSAAEEPRGGRGP